MNLGLANALSPFLQDMIRRRLNELNAAQMGSEKEQAQLATDAASASQKSDEALGALTGAMGQYPTMPQLPVPEPMSPLTGALAMGAGGMATTLSGNPAYRQGTENFINQAHSDRNKVIAENVGMAREDLLSKHKQNLEAQMLRYNVLAKHAEKLGDLDAAVKYGKQTERYGEALKALNDMEKHAATVQGGIEEAKIRAEAPKPLGVQGQSLAMTDPNAIAKGVYEGTLDPEINTYGRNLVGPITTALLKIDPKFDLVKAKQSYLGAKQFIKTVNGRQFQQVKVSTETAFQLVDRVEQLNNRLKELVPRGDIQKLGTLQLGAARDWGTYGPEAIQIAQELVQTIESELQPDLANIYRAGNATTDQAERQAGAGISSTMTPRKLDAAIANLRATLPYRVNSINSATATVPSGTPGEGTTSAVGWNPVTAGQPEQVLPGTRMRAIYAAKRGDAGTFRRMIQENPELNNDPQIIEAARKLKKGTK